MPASGLGLPCLPGPLVGLRWAWHRNIFSSGGEKAKTQKPDFSRPEPLSFCLLLGILTCVAYFYRKALRESYFSSASRRLIEEPRSTDTSS